MSCGYFHSAAVKTDGTLWTWGYNSFGQLGNNTTTNTSSPGTTIGGGTTWAQVSAGDLHTAAIKTDGTLWTWGYNSFGQLGDGTIVNKSSPGSTAGGGTTWRQVSAGKATTTGSFTAAVKTDGTLWTWGSNYGGVLGNAGTNSQSISSPGTTAGGGTNWASVASGYYNIQATKTDGTLWSCGYNAYGELGDGTFSSRTSPVTVAGGGTTWSTATNAIGAGRASGALKTDGTLWTWGNNAIGQLGNGVTANFLSPITIVGGGTTWSTISAGTTHAGAIKTDGTLWMWGHNHLGQLGVGNISSYASPVTIAGGGTSWSRLVCGYYHSAAVKTDGTLWAWGYDFYGQLGDGTIVNKSSPVTVAGGGTTWNTTTGTISAGYYSSAAIKTDGNLWAWGLNTFGQIGNNTTSTTSIPTLTQSWIQVADHSQSFAAIKTDGSLWTWGYNSYGQLGNNTNTTTLSPGTTIGGGTNWKQVALATSSMLAVKTDGTLWSWGYNGYGQLGTGNYLSSSSPITVAGGGTNWAAVAIGYGGYPIVPTTLATKTDGSLWVWGDNSVGQLALNLPNGYSSPVTTAGGGTTWKQVDADGYQTAAIKTDGTLWTWGNNQYGMLGDGTVVNKSSPVTVAGGGTTWSQVSVGVYHTGAIKTDGTLWTWGYNFYGQLGTGNTVGYSSPVTTAGGGTTWKQVAVGNYHSSYAIKTDGTLWTWGYNLTYGALGDGTVVNKSSPATVAGGGTTWNQVAAGFALAIAVKTDGTLWSWGNNAIGQLGDGASANKSSPSTTIGGGTNWSQVSANMSSPAAVKTDGTLWAWGNNANGQLGNNTTTNSSSPGTTIGGGTTWAQVACGYYHTVATKTDGTVWGFGDNTYGQLGNNTTTTTLSPVSITVGATAWSTVTGTISAGQYHSGGIKTDGTLWTWGRNKYGALGVGFYNISSVNSPISIAYGGATWNTASYAISVNNGQVGAIKTDGTLWMWGWNPTGQLGDGTTSNRSSPVQTAGTGSNWVRISTNGGYGGGGNLYQYGTTAGLKSDGTLWLWGSDTYGTRSGLGSSSSPTTISGGGTTWASVSMGGRSAEATKTDGTLWSWGSDSRNGTQAGPGGLQTVYGGGTNWLPVVFNMATIQTNAAVKSDGTLWVCGYNYGGILGAVGNPSFVVSPMSVTGGGTGWVSVINAEGNPLAIKTDGTLWACGYAAFGANGGIAGKSLTSFTSLTSAGYGWRQQSRCRTASVGVKTDGTLWTWGDNGGGECGDGRPLTFLADTSIPATTLGGGTTWKQASACNYTMAAIKTDGTLWTWGGTVGTGKLGQGTFTGTQSSPATVISNITNWKQVAMGSYHAGAIGQ